MTDHQELEQQVEARIRAAQSGEELKAIDREVLGKGGAVASLLAQIPKLEPSERGAAGRAANELKQKVRQLLAARDEELAQAAVEAARAGGDFDPTLPGAAVERGGLHPITQVTRELEAIFTSMGYTVLDGPEVELDYYNFEALNISADHPARDSQDTFYLEGAADLVLRTHTSPVQIRAMETMSPPIRAIAPGKVFRQETTDASHDHTFHQMEGVVVDEGISVGHLIGTMRTFLRELFQTELEVRLRPGFFPFVEPGFELDVRCPFCDGSKHCGVCKDTRWIELCPCGMVHPNVLKFGGIDTERYSGFAFGLGLSRLVMVRHGIDDVRHLLSGDLRFLEQFN